jgi:hypothetical protein
VIHITDRKSASVGRQLSANLQLARRLLMMMMMIMITRVRCLWGESFGSRLRRNWTVVTNKPNFSQSWISSFSSWAPKSTAKTHNSRRRNAWSSAAFVMKLSLLLLSSSSLAESHLKVHQYVCFSSLKTSWCTTWCIRHHECIIWERESKNWYQHVFEMFHNLSIISRSVSIRIFTSTFGCQRDIFQSSRL